jgi:hypothetical protein
MGLSASTLLPSCKSTKNNSSETKVYFPDKETDGDRTKGMVSHRLRASGCKTIIEVKVEEETMVLIPKDPLPTELDKDGLMIEFHYRVLRMPQPEGCTEGRPAAVMNLSASK